MGKDTIVLANTDQGIYNYVSDEDVTIQYHNLAPYKVGTDQYAMGPRPTFGAVTTTASVDNNSRGRGIAEFLGYDLFMCNDDTMYYSGGSTEIFSTQGFAKELIAKYSHYSQAGSPRLVCVHAGDTSTAGTNDGAVWFHTDTTSAPTQVTDADMPGNNGQSLIRGGVSLDGYFLVSDIDGKIQNCDLDDLTAWSAINFITAERVADYGVYLGKHHDHVVWIGTQSIEFFYNAANATGSPLARRQDVFYNIGCYHPNSVLELGDRIFFIGKNVDGEIGLMMIEGFKITNITSDNAILDKYIKALEYQTPAIASADNLQQNVYLATFNSSDNGQFLVLTLPTGSFSLHLDTSIWAKWYMAGTPTTNGGIADWTDPKIFPITASLNRPGTNSTAPNRWMLLNGYVSLEQPYVAGVVAGGSVLSVFESTASTEWSALSGSGMTDAQASSTSNANCSDASNTRLYLCPPAGAVVYQYSLSTAGAVSTIAYVGNKDLATGAASVIRMSLNSDGTRLMIDNNTANQFEVWTLSTPYDITTATDDTNYFDTSGFSPSASKGIYLKDSSTFWFIDQTGTDTLREYSGSSYDFSSATATGKTLVMGATGAESGAIYDFTVSADGLSLFAFKGDTSTYGYIQLWTMSTAFDISTATFTQEVLLDNTVTTSGWTEGDSKSLMGNTSSTLMWLADTGTNTSDLEGFSFDIPALGVPVDFNSTNGITGNPSMHMYTRPWDLETSERKIIDSIRVLHYPSAATYAGTSNLGIQWLDTDKATDGGVVDSSFNTIKNVNIATATPKLHRGGQTRQRYFKLTFSGEKTQRVRALEINYRPSKG